MEFELTIKRLAGILAVLGLCLGLRVGYQWFYLNYLRFRMSTNYQIDTDNYGAIGENLAQGKGYTLQGHPTASRLPLYPVVLGIFYKTFGIKHSQALIFQAILDTLIALLIFLIAARLFRSYRYALLAALFWAVNIPEITLLRRLYTEPLFILLFCSFFYSVIKVEGPPSDINWVSWGIQEGLLSLCRPSFLLFPPVIAFYFITRPYVKKKSSARGVGIMLLFWMLAVSPWVIRNYLESGKFILGTTILGWNICDVHEISRDREVYEKLNEIFPSKIERICAGRIRVRPGPENISQEYNKDQIYRKHFYKKIDEEPEILLRDSVRNLLAFYFDYDYSWKMRSWKSYFIAFSNFSLLILALLSICKFGASHFFKGTPLWVVLGYFHIVGLLGSPSWRHYQINIPFMILLAVPALAGYLGLEQK